MSEHGTLANYRRGCRCPECRASNVENYRKYTATARGGGLVSVDRDVLSDLLNEIFPLGLTDDCPARRRAAA